MLPAYLPVAYFIKKMIPLRDNIPHIRKPIITVLLLFTNIFVFLFQLSLGDNLKNFMYIYGFVPKNLFLPLYSDSLILRFRPLVTSMFLHASPTHLIGNMLFLWIFGDNVEDRLGHLSFLLFYISCGIIAGITHLIMNINSSIPAVGASGAIAGILGAYMVMFPQSMILTLVPFFLFWRIVELPAFIFIGIWFVYQFLLGISTIGYGGAGIAFWAHIGGFIAGIFIIRYFKKKRRYYYYS
ncbi:MAG: rhomboid family intramembrane serine protease [Candidatus Omnitrophica bacterium]|nr:rhomboid family intramembrane serine protease [Candidatus Omnitrophota bacterium]